MFGFLQNCYLTAIFVGLKRIFVLIQTVSESNIVSTKIMIKGTTLILNSNALANATRRLIG